MPYFPGESQLTSTGPRLQNAGLGRESRICPPPPLQKGPSIHLCGNRKDFDSNLSSVTCLLGDPEKIPKKSLPSTLHSAREKKGANTQPRHLVKVLVVINLGSAAVELCPCVTSLPAFCLALGRVRTRLRPWATMIKAPRLQEMTPLNC